MTNEELKIAGAFVACSRWQWLPGMRRLTFDAGHLYPSRVADDGTYPGGLFPAPDITDPCTKGGILKVVRDAHGVQWLTTVPLMTAGGVHGWLIRGLDTPVCKSEAEALLRALQAAPEVANTT